MIVGGRRLKYKILTDSSCDLPLEFVEANADILLVVGMPIEIENESYVDDLGKTLKHDFFYKKLEQGAFPTTSQINTTVYLEQYENCYTKNEAVICAGLSSGLSGTMNNAVLAKKMFLEEHPDADITVVDTISASGGLAALLAEAVSCVRKGFTKEKLVEWFEEKAICVNHWFAIDDLEHLRKGGRIPAAIAIVGTALKVKPILTMTTEGKLKSYASVRGRNKSIRFLYDQFVKTIGTVEEKIVFICHAHCENDAIELHGMITTTHKPREIIITDLSATIGTHVGIGMLAVAYIGDCPRD